MTVHPSRVPVKPAYLLKLHVSNAHVSAPADNDVMTAGRCAVFKGTLPLESPC